MAGCGAWRDLADKQAAVDLKGGCKGERARHGMDDPSSSPPARPTRCVCWPGHRAEGRMPRKQPLSVRLSSRPRPCPRFDVPAGCDATASSGGGASIVCPPAAAAPVRALARASPVDKSSCACDTPGVIRSAADSGGLLPPCSLPRSRSLQYRQYASRRRCSTSIDAPLGAHADIDARFSVQGPHARRYSVHDHARKRCCCSCCNSWQVCTWPSLGACTVAMPRSPRPLPASGGASQCGTR